MEIAIQKTTQEAPAALEETVIIEEFINSSESEDFIKAPANIYEDEAEYRVEFLMPGYTKESFEIEVSATGILSVSTRFEQNKKYPGENVLRKEFSIPAYFRFFQLPEDSVNEETEASYEGGVLTITVPRDFDWQSDAV